MPIEKSTPAPNMADFPKIKRPWEILLRSGIPAAYKRGKLSQGLPKAIHHTAWFCWLTLPASAT
jgi:hypothetical protein